MDGYIKILVAGQEVGLKFGYPAIRWFSEESELNKSAFFMPGESFDFSVEGFAKLMQCGYRNHCLIKEVDPELKYQDFVEWVEVENETEDKQAMKDVLKAYTDSSVMKKAIEAVEKKKQEEETPPLTST